MQQEWNGLWVCEKCFEPRHPQYDVKGRADRQNVPVARPNTVDTFNTTTLGAAASKGDTSITVASATGIEDNYSIGIVLDNESIHWTLVNGDPVGTTVTLEDAIAEADAASGNTVYIPGDSFIEPTATTVNDL